MLRVSLVCLLAMGASAFSVSPLSAISTRSVSSRAGLSCVRMNADQAKKLAGYKAVDDHVTSGMVVGLGTGSTAYFAVERVGQKLASGELKDVICIPTSERTREQAESLKVLAFPHKILHVILDSSLPFVPEQPLNAHSHFPTTLSDKFVLLWCPDPPCHLEREEQARRCHRWR
jgi:hypothetical protein